MGDYTGIYVSVNCGDLGIFQGQISVIDSCGQRMILEKAFHNGRPYLSRQVTIEVDDIKSLEMIDAYNDPSQPSVNNGNNSNNNNNCNNSNNCNNTNNCNNSNNNNNCNNSNNIAKPIATKPTNACEVQKCCKESNIKECPKKNFENKTGFHNENVKPLNKKEKYKQKWISRDEAAFGSPIDRHMLTDFDFEKNLALFNKKAFYEELNASKPDMKKTDKKGGKYRWDENILSSKPATLRQLFVPKSDSIEYVTDTGLIIPSLTPEVRKQLFRVAERHGLTFERQSEIIGRACTEMALHLLGGAHRLNPHNQHQCPSVVILCGSHRNGSLGISSARQLASHGVRTIVLLHDSGVLTSEMTHELELYRMTCNKLTINIQDLYAAPVDLIIVALSDSKFSDRVSPLARWVNENRAQVLALDPPQRGIPGINIKCSLIPGLPLAYDSSNGKIYLCNLGIPVQVFKSVGIKYVPPFGPKFFMPLYPNNI